MIFKWWEPNVVIIINNTILEGLQERENWEDIGLHSLYF